MQKYNLARLDNITPEKRSKILRVAAEEFAAMGYTKANTNIIAKKAGISVGSLFKYFGNKENCFLSVLNEGITQLEQYLNEVMSGKEPVLQKIEKLVKLIPEHSSKNSEIVRLYFEVTHESESKQIREFSKKFEGLSAKAYRKIMEDAKKEGLIPENADEQIYAFCMDNLFMMLQFSYACPYYQNRKSIYLGEKKAKDSALLTSQIMAFLTKGFNK
ncbi:MAG: TetR/AcrR family transcriptional regulator [Spirochaetota bacterium]